jgi:tetratricopeptide (TPR) repeat protein
VSESLYRRALDGREKVLGPDHPHTLESVGRLAGLYLDCRRYQEAVPLLERAVGAYTKRPEMAAYLPYVRANLGLALIGAGSPASAEPHLLAGYDGLTNQKALDATDRNRMRRVTAALVEVYDKTGQPEKGKEWRAKLATLGPEVAPPPREAKRP